MSFSFISPLTTNAKEQTVSIVGRVYEFEEKSEYEVDSSKSTSTSENSQTLGQFSITGDISKEYTNKGFTAYEITDGTIISIQYKGVSRGNFSCRVENWSSLFKFVNQHSLPLLIRI